VVRALSAAQQWCELAPAVRVPHCARTIGPVTPAAGHMNTAATAANLRVPALMCHGIRTGGDATPSAYPLTEEHFEKLVAAASELGFQSISYDQLECWRAGDTEGLPARPIMWDVDHPVKGVLGIARVLKQYGMAGNLFVNTAVMGPVDEWGMEPYPGVRDQAPIVAPERGGPAMSWGDIRGLVRDGWHIGAHTVTHPDLSELATTDPTGTILLEELEACDATLHKQLGRQPRDFAFTSTTFSTIAAKLVGQRYRFGRLWIIGSHYQVSKLSKGASLP
jgi:peptidoglycan/xylan/chitin deacetylase (PgdA/CDA1 family)